ncbi:MAG: hypothetical protein QM655_03280 [Nocardioidaceae bacterium]
MTDLSPDGLRTLVSEVVREAVAELRAHSPVGPQAVLASDPGDTRSGTHGEARRRTEGVRIVSDQDLAAFTRRLLVLFENPKTRQELRNGWLSFRLEGAPPSGVAARWPIGGAAGPSASVRIDRGAVTERRIIEAAEAGHSLVVARGAVLTPLARDKARALGVHIEKER